MNPFHEDYSEFGSLYAHLSIEGTIYLAFRDLTAIIKTYLPNPSGRPLKTLDFGCGTGLSTRFLKHCQHLLPYPLEVEGADISEAVLKLAQEADPEGHYVKMNQQQVPVADSTYDFVHNSFVLFEMESIVQMTEVLQDIYRVMKKGGLLIATTGSVDQYDWRNRWVSLKGDFPENENLRPGQLGRIDLLLQENKITFHNYFWRQEDYEKALSEAHFTIHQVWRPLGYKAEEVYLPWAWKDETKVSPYYMLIAQK